MAQLFNLYDGAMAYNPLWNVDNGITLCHKCHTKLHKEVCRGAVERT